jgi:hypothetical protein
VVRWPLIEALVRPVVIEVSGVLSQNGGVTLVVDQHPVGALRPGAAYESFGVAVRSRCPRRSFHDLDSFGREYSVEPGGELRFSVSDEEPERRDPFCEVHRQGACLLNDPGGGGCAVTPRMCARRVRPSIANST